MELACDGLQDVFRITVRMDVKKKNLFISKHVQMNVGLMPSVMRWSFQPVLDHCGVVVLLLFLQLLSRGF